MQNIRPLVATLAFSLLVTGCGRDAAETAPQTSEEATAASAPDTTQPAAATAPSAGARTLSVDDIDRWQRGMQAELKAVQDAAAQLAQAKDENAKLEALQAATEMRTIDVAAEAAGVDRDTYRRFRNAFSHAVSLLTPIESEMDVSQMPAEMIEQLKQTRDASAKQLESELPADVLDALKTRALDLRTQEKTLVGERLKVATGKV